mgnify:CR=1 FL=1
MEKKFKRTTVTSALPYANGPVHIGHLAGVYVPADIYVRYLRLKKEDVIFIGGSDEHGVPITIRAKKEGVTPQDIVDRYHTLIKESFKEFGISFDVYSRTSSKTHHDTASEFFRKLYDKGDFIEKTSMQYYDEEAKTFLADRYITGECPHCHAEGAYGDQCEKCGTSLSPTDLINPKSAISGSKPVMRETKHWYLPLDQHESWLRQWILEDHKEWRPNVYGQCKSWLDMGLQPRAVSRDLDWGIPVPVEGAEGKVLYVWFDAPIGYISNTKELLPDTWETWWKDPETRLIHFIGKDNIVFHCIVFPAMLKAEGSFILPDNVPSNEFLNLEGDKISTSRNWAVWLHEYLVDFPGKQDVLRYVLTANAPETKDNDFTWKDFQARNNNELVAVYGNFVNRALQLTKKYFDGVVPAAGELTEYDRETLKEFSDVKAEVEKLLDVFKFRDAQKEAMNLARIGNKYLADTEPWKIAKTDMIDPHWYVNPEFFFQNTTIFDNHPRGKYDVYVGEYACNANVGGGNMRAALSEAAFISGMERNGDLVKMTSYAPLLEKRNDRSWAVNLIWLDTDQVLGRSSYYVQQMAAENRPTYNVKSNMTMSTPRIADYNEGRFGFGSWHTQVEFKDVKLTGADGAPIDLDLNKAVKKEGEWSLDNGLLKQTSLREPAKYIVDGFNGNQFTLEFKVRKEGGNEGFFLYFGLSEDSNKGFVYNVAGWNNGTTAVEGVIGGRTSGVAGDRVSHSLETDKWYDAKLVVTPQKSELFMDGKLILAHAPETTPLQFFSSGYDEATGEVIVKVVNSEAQSYPLRIKLDGVDSVEKTGKVISLSAASDMDENSFEEPMKISPKESEYKGFGKSFDYTFPPFSYTILRVKAK